MSVREGIMQLYIVRHGIAIDREDPKCPPDPERYLTEEGLEKTKQVTKGVAALCETADLFLTSPYVGAEPSLLFRELAKDKQVSTVFLFGHAPQLDDVIATALGSKKHLTALKKAGVAFVELKRLSPPIGELVWLATPKLLRRAGK